MSGSDSPGWISTTEYERCLFLILWILECFDFYFNHLYSNLLRLYPGLLGKVGLSGRLLLFSSCCPCVLASLLGHLPVVYTLVRGKHLVAEPYETKRSCLLKCLQPLDIFSPPPDRFCRQLISGVIRCIRTPTFC